MSKNRSSALKRDRERRKAEKHALKRLRREERRQSAQQPQESEALDNPVESAEYPALAESPAPGTGDGDSQSSRP